MLIHVAYFEYNNTKHWGVVEGDQLHCLKKKYSNTAEIIDDRLTLIQQYHSTPTKITTEKTLPIADVTLLSPVTGNRRVICQGANYRQHMIESGMNPDEKAFNMFFNKSSAAICSAVGNITKPKHVRLLDYEIELGLVIADPISQNTTVTEENLWQHIAGIVITNDVSARDVQIPETQFFKGKSYRSFCPVGPYLCLLDQNSFHYLQQLELELRVNGEIRQKDTTANLVFKPAETLTELSTFSDLETGDLLMTGTPSGCALQLPSPLIVKLFSLLPDMRRWRLFTKIQEKNNRYLKKNDVIEATIKSYDNRVDLGTQCNTVIHEN